jgi:hypothetical protein
MAARIRRHVSYANVMATIAMFIAIGGGAYAASTINGSEIKSRTIKGKKIVKQGITRKEVKNDTLRGAQIDESTLGIVPNADKVDGLDSTDFLGSGDVRADGTASSTDIDNFTTTTYTDVVSTTVNAPKAGFLFITGTLSAEDDGSFAGRGDLFYRLALDATGLTNDAFYHEISTNGAAGVNIIGGSGAASAVVPVTAGSHAVSLQARESGTGSFILGKDISVIFVPNGSGSTPPFRSVSASGSSTSPQK